MVITGGIGSAPADGFPKTGSTVLTADLPGSGADRELDVTDAGATATAIAGLDRLDVVVANAGIGVSGLVGHRPRRVTGPGNDNDGNHGRRVVAAPASDALTAFILTLGDRFVDLEGIPTRIA